MIKRLFLDIETSPNICYSWNIGYKVNLNHDNIIEERKIICICYKWHHEKKVHSIEWDIKKRDDIEVLKHMQKILTEAQEVIAHNGNNFDIPWINTRFVKHKIKPPSYYKQIDTCQIARNKFYFNSNKLDYLSRFIFDDKKADSGGFQCWKDIMSGSEKALRKMVKYCKKDVLLLEKVYNIVSEYVPQYTHAGVTEGKARWSCPRCGGENVRQNGNWVTKAGMERYEMNCTDCGRYYTVSSVVIKQYQSKTTK